MRIARNDFARLLQQVVKAVNSRNTIPVLGTLRLEASGGTLTVTATDLDLEISGSIEAEGDYIGCIDARMLAAAVGKFKGDEVTIDADGDDAVIKSGRSRFKMQTIPVGDFPTMDGGKFSATLTLDLAALFAPVAFAMSVEDARYYLNGIYMHQVDGKLVAVATDGHRLSANSIDAPHDQPPADFAGIIIPTKTVNLLPKGEVTVDISDSKIRITDGKTTILSKLIDGTFPDYQRVIPSGNDKNIVFDNATMRDAADRVALASNERGRAVNMTITEGVCDLTVRGDAEATDSVSVDYSGEEVNIGFNSRYVVDVLGALPPGDVNMAVADGGAPALLTSDKAPSQRIVIMPMRV